MEAQEYLTRSNVSMLCPGGSHRSTPKLYSKRQGKGKAKHHHREARCWFPNPKPPGSVQTSVQALRFLPQDACQLTDTFLKTVSDCEDFGRWFCCHIWERSVAMMLCSKLAKGQMHTLERRELTSRMVHPCIST